MAPLVICQFGSRLGMVFQTANPISPFYYSLPLELVTCLWWGPRALAGIFVNGVVTAAALGHQTPAAVLSIALAKTAQIALAYFLFARLGKGKAWLPDFDHLVRLILLAGFPLCFTNGFGVAGIDHLLQNSSADFLVTARFAALSTGLDLLAGDIPTLVLFTAWLERRGWTLTRGAKLPIFLEHGAPLKRKIELGVLAIGLTVFGLLLPYNRFWFLYAAPLIWAAMRFGFGVSILFSIWTQVLVVYLPATLPYWPADFHLSSMEDRMATHLTMVIPLLAVLLIGRALSDLLSEIKMRRESEKALRNSEESFRQLVANSPNGVLVEQDGIYVYSNPEAQRMLGYSQEELERTSVLNVIHPDEHRTIQERLRRAAKGHNNQPLVITVVRKDGSTFLAESTSVPITYNGRPAALILSRDVTEVKRSEEALRRSEELFRQLAENLQQVLWIRDFATQRIVYVNPAYEKIFGQTCESLYADPRSFMKVIHPDDQDRVKKAVQAQYKNHIPFDEQYRIVRSNGEVRWIWARNYPLRDAHGTLYRLFGMADDITEAHRSEEALRASLEEKNALLREIHHRVKNNMQVIISLLDMQAHLSNDPHVREQFIESETRIRSMAMVHEQLYRSSSMAHLNFSDYLERLAWDINNAYNIHENITLRLDIEPVTLDIEQAVPCGLLVNEIITNAFKHAFPDGRAGQVCIELHRVDDEILLRIQDDGVGFPEHLDVHNLDSMGLKLIHLLARQIGAEVRLENNHGAAFQLHIKTAASR